MTGSSDLVERVHLLPGLLRRHPAELEAGRMEGVPAP